MRDRGSSRGALRARGDGRAASWHLVKRERLETRRTVRIAARRRKFEPGYTKAVMRSQALGREHPARKTRKPLFDPEARGQRSPFEPKLGGRLAAELLCEHLAR